MGMNWDWSKTLRLGTAVLAVAIMAVPGAAFARGESWVIDDDDDAGCASGESSFDIYTVYPDDLDFVQNTMVFVGTDVYMDESTTPSRGEGTRGLFSSNDRGRQNMVFPLPEATPYRMTNEIKNSDGDIVWESTVIVDDCTDPSITLNVHGPASQRVLNKGFEKAGSSKRKAKKWSGDPAGVTKRMCPVATDTVFAGECSLRVRPSANQTSSLKQTVLPDLSQADDVIRLSAMVRADGLQGGGKLKLTVKYEDGSKGKISIEIPEGDYDFQWLADDVVVTGKVRTMDVSIVVKQGGGRFYVDDLMVTEIANGLPLPNPPILVF